MHPTLRFLTAFALVALMVLLAVPLQQAVAQERGSKPLRAAKALHKNGIQSDTRIVGGEDTTIEENPWQVALLNAEDPYLVRAQFCGGVIIHPRWVLTAAHCVDGGTIAADIHVLSGTDNLTTGRGVRGTVKDIFVHEGWKQARNFDIALIEMENPLRGKPISAPTDSSLLVAGAKIWVSGWGVTEKSGGKATRQLQGISLDFIPQGTEQGECNYDLAYGGRVTGNMFCAGVAGRAGGGGRDSCQGDSGGPATIGLVENAKLVGLVSWGEGCAKPFKYGVYTRVPSFADWVRTKTRRQVSW